MRFAARFPARRSVFTIMIQYNYNERLFAVRDTAKRESVTMSQSPQNDCDLQRRQSGYNKSGAVLMVDHITQTQEIGHIIVKN